jgi:hypothetical protein
MIQIAKCGCDCLRCPTYKENIRTPEERKKCSDGWKKYLNITLSPEKLRPCDGCSLPDDERKVYYLNCIVRKCAMMNGIENCAHCTAFPCDELLNIHSIQKIKNRNEFITAYGKEIPENDYRLFIEPYTGMSHLSRIRNTLIAKDLKDYKKFSVKTRLAPSAGSSIEQGNLSIIQSLLRELYIEHDISYARLKTLEKNREQLLKILWTIGFYGTLNENHHCLELDSETYMSQKTSKMYNTLLSYFSDLNKYGIHCDIVPLVEKGWVTPAGGLRKEGWIIRFSFGKSGKEMRALSACKEHILELNRLYGDKAFRMFTRAERFI